MLGRPADPRRRRAAAHACPRCRQPWAVRGSRTPSGSWLFSCRFCSWSDVRGAGTAPDAPGTWVHGVHFYTRDSDLVAHLADYLTEGWSQGGVAVVVATAEHRTALRREIGDRGLEAALGGGRLIELDAADTLRLFMRDGSPDPQAFQDTVGSLVREHATGAPLRAFGEMVDLLWSADNATGALQLEQLWGRLQQSVAFSLLCAYAADRLHEPGRSAVRDAHDYAVA